MLTTALVMLLLVLICNVILYRTFNLYLETLTRYELEEDEERTSILEETLKDIRKRMRIITSLSMVIMALTPILILTTE